MGYYEDAGILGASAANRFFPNKLSTYRGEDYVAPRFWNPKPSDHSLESLLRHVINANRGMTTMPDASTGLWHSTDPSYAQGFTSDAEIPIIRQMDVDLPNIEQTPLGKRKSFNQLFKDQHVAMDYETPYNVGSKISRIFPQEDLMIDDYYAKSRMFDNYADPSAKRGWRAGNLSEGFMDPGVVDDQKLWSRNKPVKYVTGLEKQLANPGFYSSASAWPYGSEAPFERSWFLSDYLTEMGPEGDQTSFRNKFLNASPDTKEGQIMASLKEKYASRPEYFHKHFNKPSLTVTPGGVDTGWGRNVVQTQSKINLPLSLQAAAAQHINQDPTRYLHRGQPNLSKAPLNTWRGIGQFLNTAKNVVGAKASDIYQGYTPTKANWGSWLNNAATRTLGKGARFIGGVGDVALGGMALADVYGGTNLVGNSVRDVNEMMGVPMDRQGNVIQSNRVYENLQNAAQRDVQNPNEMRGVTSFDTTRYNPHAMNAGGIVSLMV